MNLKAGLRERGPLGGQLLNTELIEDYLAFESIPSAELARRMAEHARRFGLEVQARRIKRWGATSDEASRSLPGDDEVPLPLVASMRAVAIRAPADSVWPWLVQMGVAGRDDHGRRGPPGAPGPASWQSGYPTVEPPPSPRRPAEDVLVEEAS
jgi:alkyl hydroperoxide reductase subunit AhpF